MFSKATTHVQDIIFNRPVTARLKVLPVQRLSLRVWQKRSGQSIVEMVFAMVVIIPLLALLVDDYFIVLGYWISSTNCRLAARAASQGPPEALVKGAPKQRAMSVLNTSFAQVGKTMQIANVDVSESITSLPDKVGGGAVNGSVTVKIAVDVVPPFMLKSFLPNHKYTVQVSNTCPYTWTSPFLISPVTSPMTR